MDRNTETALRPASSTTAFLESPRIDRVPEELKLQLVDIYSKTGNLTASCRQLGIDPRNMRLHYNQDDRFKRAIDEAREQLSDKAEGHIVEHMSNRGNVIDRLAWLRAWRPDRWNPMQQVNVTVEAKQHERLMSDAKAYIDTTATPVQVMPCLAKPNNKSI